MALKIRLRRMGRKKAPTYRIVVAESSMPRDGRFVANLGHYNPRTEPATLVVDREKALYWIGKGAQPTDTVVSLLRKAGMAAPEPTVVEAAVTRVKQAGKVAGGAAAKAAAAVKSVAAEVVETVQEVVEEVRERVTGDDATAGEPEAQAAEGARDDAGADEAKAE